MTNSQGQSFDPFEQGDGVKAVSFKDAPIGSVISIQIDDDAKWLQSRDFETGELAYWDARPGETPNPKMSAVVTGTVLGDSQWAVQSGQAGERRSVWAQKPSNLFTAIQNAKRVAGGGTAVPILAGGRLDIAYVGEEPNKQNPRLNNIKLYQARYTPPPPGYGQQDAFEGNQPFGGQQAQPAQQQPQAPAAQQPAAQGQPFGQPGVLNPASQGASFGQPQPFQPQPAPQGQPFGQGTFGQQAPAAAAAPQQGNPFGQQAQPQQQPAMAGAPAGDPWGGQPAASQGVPPF